jgi:hypothetical protein
MRREGTALPETATVSKGHARGQKREWDELEKERAAKHRECLYYCVEEGNFRTSLGPVKVRPPN